MAIGGTALVRGTVIAEPRRIGLPSVFVIGDASGGLPVRLTTGQPAPARGRLVEVRGTLAAPYGQLELRLASGGLTVIGAGTLPPPASVTAGAIGEAIEGSLVTIRGSLTAGASRSGSDLVATLRGTDGAVVRIYADASSGVTPQQLRRGMACAITGIVGQHAGRKGALDGYRLWLRDASDIGTATSPGPSPAPTAAVSPGASPSAGPTPATGTSADPGTNAAPAPGPIALAKVRDGALVTVEGTVTISRTLLDASGRRALLEDATGAIELYLVRPDETVRTGARLRVTGTMGKAYGAPRLRVRDISVLGWQPPVVHDLRVAPGPATEWRLVRVTGTITALHRIGDRWLAEVATSAGTTPVAGVAGAGIPAASLSEGRRITVTGIVRRPYPSATDRRFALIPRGPSDLVLGPAPVSGAGAGSGGSAGAGPGGTPGGSPSASSTAAPAPAAPTTDLSNLAAHLGDTVAVGGLVTDLETGGVRLDDGTATARIVLDGDAGGLVALLNLGDAISATGTVEQRDELVVVVKNAAELVVAGDPTAGTDAQDPADTSPAPSAWNATPGTDTPAALAANASTLGLGTAGPGAGWLAAGTLLLAGLAGLVAALAHRGRERRRLRARILSRLEALGGPETSVGMVPKGR